MSNIFRGEGDVVQIVAPSTLTSGTPIRVSPGLFGVPETDAASGASVGLRVEGVHALPKVGGGGITFALGAKVYWNQSSGKATATATDDLIGVCVVAAANGDTSVQTLINGRVQDAVDADGVAGALGSLNGHVVKTSSTAVAAVKDNLAASAAPTVTDDSASGYAVGSEWLDTTNKIGWRCFDASVGAAVWQPQALAMAAGNATITSGTNNVTVGSLPSKFNGCIVQCTLKNPTNIAASPATLKASVVGGTLTITLIKADDATAINAAANLPIHYVLIAAV